MLRIDSSDYLLQIDRLRMKPIVTMRSCCQTVVLLRSALCNKKGGPASIEPTAHKKSERVRVFQTAHRGQLGRCRSRCFLYIFRRIQSPAGVGADLFARVARMDRVEVCLSPTCGETEDTERRDYGGRSSAKQPVSLAPTRRPIAISGRGHKRHALDQAPALVVHERH